MRLIDADVMIDILRKSNESHATNSREEVLLERNVRLVEEQAKYHPVIIEQRPHGEWIKGGPWSRGVGMSEQYGYYYTCSECGYKIEGGYKSCGINFCQKCGSDNRKQVNSNG